MSKTVYVIGHRNPDTDSIASAIAYADLKRQLGQTNVVAAMAGELNPQTRYILDRLAVKSPIYLADVHPKVKDVIGSNPVTATPDMALKDALHLFHRNKIRALPVIDSSRRPIGIVSLLKLSEEYLLGGNDRKRVVDSTLRSLCGCLEGTFLSGGPSDDLEHLYLFIGAMAEESFMERISGYEISRLMVMTGNRPSIINSAIELGVRVLIVTGGYPVSPEQLSKAADAGVVVISTPFDTATSSSLARLSIPLGCFVEKRFEKVGISESLEQLKLKLLHSGEPAVIAVEEDGTIAGIATKSSLLNPIPYALILVDHNELGQAIPGAESVEILEIIDHHKLGNPATNQPITLMVAPVGSTCTVVASMFRERSVNPDTKIAALLLSGILTDTVILKSPTTTGRDREMVVWLEQFAGLDHVTYGKEIFSACSGFSAHATVEKAVRADFKHFSVRDKTFGVGQVEVVGFNEFHELKEQLREGLKSVMDDDRLDIAGLMVTDIYSETTLFLVEGGNELAYVMGYPQLEPHLYELKGVMSRKKQMVPHLLKVLETL
jgi:manganese-dependent inorganic pyrophosphatase